MWKFYSGGTIASRLIMWLSGYSKESRNSWRAGNLALHILVTAKCLVVKPFFVDWPFSLLNCKTNSSNISGDTKQVSTSPDNINFTVRRCPLQPWMLTSSEVSKNEFQNVGNLSSQIWQKKRSSLVERILYSELDNVVHRFKFETKRWTKIAQKIYTN
jgi:hypothetical protein